MILISVLLRVAYRNYRLIMDPYRNPLRVLPPAQRFQTMVYLSAMWTAIFCASFGLWLWYGQLLLAHLLAVLGLFLTSAVFSIAHGPAIMPSEVRYDQRR